MTATPQRGADRGGLHCFLQPHSVALVGASDVAGDAGQSVMQNLLASRFPGEVYAVNPTRTSVMGRKAYPSLSSLPTAPELVVVATPADSVPGIIRECGDLGIPAALILSCGFREAGPEGAKLERETLAIARAGGVRILGPNCLGVMSPSGKLNATFTASMALPGSVAFLSQSRALCTAVLDWSLREQVGFSAVVSLGSMIDVGWADVLRHFGDDPATKSIVVYMETIGDAGAFLSAAREAALTKPVVAIKGGRTEGSDAVLDAALKRSGILRVHTIAELFYMAEVLGRQPRPNGPRLTIVTNARGPGVLARDALVAYGGELAQLTPATLDKLNNVLPPHWSRTNPVDVLGDCTPERYAKAVELALRDPNSDGVLAIVAPQGTTSPRDIAHALVKIGPSPKPLLSSFMGGSSVSEAAGTLNFNGIPSFPYPDSAARVFEYMWQYSRNLQSLYETPTLDEDGLGPVTPSVAAAIQQAMKSGRTILADAESNLILSAYRIPVRDSADGNRDFNRDGYELALRSSIDPQFGPVLQFGLGGEQFEVFRDQALALPPLNTTLARRLMEQTRIYFALKPGRGRNPIDLGQLERMVVRFSRLVVEQRRIAEIRINLSLTSGEELCAIDARMILHPASVRDEDLPRPAIRPYPIEYSGEWITRAGDRVRIRPIRPEDEPRMVAFHASLSDRSVNMRYFAGFSLQQRTTHSRLMRVCGFDYDQELALIVEEMDELEHMGKIVGVGRLVRVGGTADGEFAIVVSDAFQGRGIGTELLRRLVSIGPAEGYSCIEGWILASNTGMQNVCRALGFDLSYRVDESLVHATLAVP